MSTSPSARGPAVVPGQPAQGVPSAAQGSPIFLVGCERSGSTLLRLMLDHHPQIAWHFEFEFAVDRMSDAGKWPAIQDYHEYLSCHRVFLSAGHAIDGSLDYPSLVRSFLDQEQARSGKPIIGAMVHYHFDRLHYIWPQARFIHLIRDGRDVARSIQVMGLAGNVWSAAALWLEAEQTWERLAKRIPASRAVEVRYEQLVSEPESELARLCGFIGVPYDAAMLEYSKDTSYRPPDPTKMRQWRQKLSEREIRLLDARMGAVLVAKGYELSGLPPLRVSALGRKWLRVDDRLGRLRAGIRWFGPRLVVSTFVARRLRLRQWQKRIQLRKAEIINNAIGSE